MKKILILGSVIGLLAFAGIASATVSPDAFAELQARNAVLDQVLSSLSQKVVSLTSENASLRAQLASVSSTKISSGSQITSQNLAVPQDSTYKIIVRAGMIGNPEYGQSIPDTVNTPIDLKVWIYKKDISDDSQTYGYTIPNETVTLTDENGTKKIYLNHTEAIPYYNGIYTYTPSTKGLHTIVFQSEKYGVSQNVDIDVN